ncbi:unnamed protein product [Parajaminaea phylloscopi]
MESPTNAPALTTTVRSDPSSSRSNPLLQPDATAADLLVQYTPPQLSQYLVSVKEQLQSHDAELRALINSRYQDVLSVGNTIDAMSGSSSQLTTALESVGSGLRRGFVTKGGQGQPTSTDASSDERREAAARDLRTVEQAKHISALLLVLQEGPEEIWRLLDSLREGTSASGSSTQLASGSTHPILETAKNRLRTARKLSTAVSLLEVVAIAGAELEDLAIEGASDNMRGRDLFPHPLATHSATMATLRAELRSHVEHSIGEKSIPLSGSSCVDATLGVYKAALEASYRATAISAVSLVILTRFSPSQVGSYFLDRRGGILKRYSSNSTPSQVSYFTDSSKELLSEFFQTMLLYTRIFAAQEGGPSSSIISRVLSHTERAWQGEPQPNVMAENAGAPIELVPQTPIESISALTSAERILANLSLQSRLRSSRLKVAAPTNAKGGINVEPTVIENWVVEVTDSLIASHFNLDHTSSVVNTIPAVISVRASLQRHSSRLQKLLDGVPKLEEAAIPSMAHSIQVLQGKISAVLQGHARVIWQKDVTRWERSVLSDLRIALVTAQTSRSSHHSRGTRSYHDSDPLSTRDAGNLIGHQYLSGPAAKLPQSSQQPFFGRYSSDVLAPLSTLRSGWKALKRSARRFHGHPSDNGQHKSYATDEKSEWIRIAVDGWSALLDALVAFLQDRSLQDDDMLLLVEFSRAILCLPGPVNLAEKLLGEPSAATGTQAWEDARARLAVQRIRSLAAWRTTQIELAVSELLELEESSSTTPGAANEDKADVGNTTRNQGVSVHLLRSLALLQEASWRVIPAFASPSEVIVNLEKTHAEHGTGYENASMEDLLIGFDIAVAARLERDGPRRNSTALCRDLQIQQELVSGLTRAVESTPPHEAIDLVRLFGDKVDATLPPVDLQRALGPHMLLLGQLLYIRDSTLTLPGILRAKAGPTPPSTTEPAASTATAPPSLLDLAPFRAGGRIKGVTV